MKVELSSILKLTGGKVFFNEEISPSNFTAEDIVFTSAVKIAGQVQNLGNIFELSFHVDGKVAGNCDYCNCGLEIPLSFDTVEILKKEDVYDTEIQNIDITYFTNSTVDLDEIICNNVYLNFPTKVLCSEDCKGLCPHCGTDLNLQKCDCKYDNTDKRFDILMTEDNKEV